jgi:pimeloyl-ACP methyl ester carboxylesterase
VVRCGSGPPVLFVHGSVVDARRTWRKQIEALSARWQLCLPNRPGFAASPPIPRGDFDVEAPLIAPYLGEGSHLVGHSYGAVMALLIAAMRPEAVWSLTVSEPGCLQIAADHPEVREMMEHGDRLYGNADAIPTREFLTLFREGVHSAHETPEELPDWLERGARLVQNERPPWDGEIPLEALADAPFPKLVVSGGHSVAFEVVCDVLAERIGARREVIRGRDHTIPSTGAPYNAVLEAFMREAARPDPAR